MFEKALRMRLRFKADCGVVTSEDLWQLSLQYLDDLARQLNKEIQEKEVSFIAETTDSDAKLQLSFEIVKHIITVKLAEKEALKVKLENQQRRKQLIEALNDRRQSDLKAMSEEELLKELAALS